MPPTFYLGPDHQKARARTEHQKQELILFLVRVRANPASIPRIPQIRETFQEGDESQRVGVGLIVRRAPLPEHAEADDRGLVTLDDEEDFSPNRIITGLSRSSNPSSTLSSAS